LTETEQFLGYSNSFAGFIFSFTIMYRNLHIRYLPRIWFKSFLCYKMCNY